MVTPGWTFFTNHAHVLFSIAADPDARLRDIAAQVGITERATQRIVAELAEAGSIVVTREGRRNHYRVDGAVSLRHPIEAHRTVADLIQWLTPPA